MLWPSAQVLPLPFPSFLFHQKPKRRGKKTENKGKLNKWQLIKLLISGSSYDKFVRKSMRVAIGLLFISDVEVIKKQKEQRHLELLLNQFLCL
jgi:hypothetical protein